MISTKSKKESPPYVLGHTPAELERLIRQSSYYNAATEQVLQKAGLSPGMQVLDVGCGAGDVAFLAAKMVGPEGKVVAIDRSPDALALARHRAAEMGYENITFRQSDLNEFVPEGKFNAVIGRLILLYQQDPVRSLIYLKQWLRPGGVAAFHEFNMPAAQGWPPHEYFDRHVGIIKQIFEKGGMDPILGCRLYYHFQKAGFQNIHTEGYTNFVAGEQVLRAGEYLADTLRSLLPAAQQLGVSLPDDLDLDSLPEKLYQEVNKHEIGLTTPMAVGVWGFI